MKITATTLTNDSFSACLKNNDLPEGTLHGLRVKGQPILLVKVEGRVYAVSNICPHMGCQLQGGVLSGYVVTCPCHGWKFDVRNGQYLENPLTKLTIYTCKVEDGKVLVQVKRQW